MTLRKDGGGTQVVSIALLYPELLGTYGDGGNAIVLAQRLRWRGLSAEMVTVGTDEPAPDSCDIYVLGGGEDGPQALAVAELEKSGALHRAAETGAVVFAVCAGFQLLGHEFLGAGGEPHPGLGLLDCRTRRGPGRRRVGEILATPDPSLGLPLLTGYENHQGVTELGTGNTPLGTVAAGAGNDTGDRSEGAVSGNIFGTYLHGPALARNPALADLLLTRVVGDLSPLDDSDVEALRAERLAFARRSRWRRRR